jgi:hypothetical protein
MTRRLPVEISAVTVVRSALNRAVPAFVSPFRHCQFAAITGLSVAA